MFLATSAGLVSSVAIGAGIVKSLNFLVVGLFLLELCICGSATALDWPPRVCLIACCSVLWRVFGNL